MARRKLRENEERRGPLRTVPAEVLGDVLGFLRLLWAVDHGLTQLSKRMQRTLGVTGPQRMVVRLVAQAPGISAGALADTLHLHRSTLTGVMRRLQERGIIDRTADPTDARRARLKLTRKGEKIDAIRAGTVEARVRSALAGIPDADLAAAERVLARLATSLSVRG